MRRVVFFGVVALIVIACGGALDDTSTDPVPERPPESNGPAGTPPSPPGPPTDGAMAPFDSGHGGADATSSVDSGDEDASELADAADDAADAADAADAWDGAAGCLKPPIVDPTSRPSKAMGTPLPSKTFGCLSSPAGSTPIAYSIQFTRETRFTMFVPHTPLAEASTVVQIRDGCDMGSTLRLSARHDCKTHSMILAPGLYTFVTCDSNGAFVAEPTPTPMDTNISCASPGATLYRDYDTSPRYSRFYANGTSNYTVNVNTNGMTAGAYRLEVQSVCDASGTDVFDSATLVDPSSTACSPMTRILGVLPAGYYSVKWSNIDPALRLTAEIVRNP